MYVYVYHKGDDEEEEEEEEEDKLLLKSCTFDCTLPPAPPNRLI